MNKELEVFRCIKQDLDYFQPKDLVCTNRKEQYDIIETALKELELLKSNQIFIERAKKLKALEIIKEHPEQLLDIIDTDNYNEYLDLDYAPNQYLSEENYYLLKEVLL